MKALSVRQPWAHLIVTGIKRIENRFWTTPYRGPLLIHAASRWHDTKIEAIERRYSVSIPRDLPLGAVVGYVTLVDVVTNSRDRFFEGPFGFVFENAHAFARPFALVGRSRLFDVPNSLAARALRSERDFIDPVRPC